MKVSRAHRFAVIVPLLVTLLVCSEADAETRVLIPCAQDGVAVWRYTTQKPDDGWAQLSFDDSRWAEGKAGFGTVDYVTPPETVGTSWKSSDIWLRQIVNVAAPLDFTTAGLTVRYDEDVSVHVNGVQIFAAPGFNTKWTAYDVTRQLREVLVPGRNVVAVHVSHTAGGQYIDIGLTLDPQQELIVQIPPVDPETIQAQRRTRWPNDKAWKWYAAAGPIAGCNYLPRSAVNSTEMWQSETFDAKTIDQELGWAAAAGYNSVRVFLQYLVWKEDPDGLKRRMEEFLTIAEKHGIRVMFVPFCDCAFAGRDPYLGPQDEPRPGVHNSGWVPSPGLKRVVDARAWPDLERYIKDLVGHFGRDRRVLAWDLYNEPGQSGLGEESLPLVTAAFGWARDTAPTQPLTVGAWVDFESRMSQALMEMSDIVSFHGYDNPEGIARKCRVCGQYERPVLCTEWLNRGAGNTFEAILPIFAAQGVGGYHWGLVAGRTQTYMPWGSKEGDPMPPVWQHDVMRADGSPYEASEFEVLRRYLKEFRQR